MSDWKAESSRSRVCLLVWGLVGCHCDTVRDCAKGFVSYSTLGKIESCL